MEEKVKKLKLADLIKGETLNQLDIDQLADIQGGFALMDGCYSGVCLNERSTAEDLCSAAWCTSGVGG